MSAPIEVTQDHRGDWYAVCDGTCDEPLSLTCSRWSDAYEVSIGHACMRHPQPCDHEFGYHPLGKPEENRCLGCGVATPLVGAA